MSGMLDLSRDEKAETLLAEVIEGGAVSMSSRDDSYHVYIMPK